MKRVAEIHTLAAPKVMPRMACHEARSILVGMKCRSASLSKFDRMVRRLSLKQQREDGMRIMTWLVKMEFADELIAHGKFVEAAEYRAVANKFLTGDRKLRQSRHRCEGRLVRSASAPRGKGHDSLRETS